MVVINIKLVNVREVVGYFEVAQASFFDLMDYYMLLALFHCMVSTPLYLLLQ